MDGAIGHRARSGKDVLGRKPLQGQSRNVLMRQPLYYTCHGSKAMTEITGYSVIAATPNFKEVVLEILLLTACQSNTDQMLDVTIRKPDLMSLSTSSSSLSLSSRRYGQPHCCRCRRPRCVLCLVIVMVVIVLVGVSS